MVARADNNQHLLTYSLGRINQQKQTTPSADQGHGYNSSGQRWSPYSRSQQGYRGRSHARPIPTPTHRNRTLVVNNGSKPSDAAKSQNLSSDGAVSGTATPTGWVSTRDRGHLQLINTSVYDQKAQEKQKAIEQTALAKQQQRDLREKNKVFKHFHGAASVAGVKPAQPTAPREIVVNNLRFRVTADGSKLIRIFGTSPRPSQALLKDRHLKCTDGPNATAESTPKQTRIAGVTFHRSKNGNLLRSGLVKKQRYNSMVPAHCQKELQLMVPRHRTTSTKKSTKLCPRFTPTGTQESKTQSRLDRA